MTLYCLKAILCSGVLLLVYLLFLEKEKMHRFNRFYLLGCLLFSITVPLILLPVKATQESLPITQGNYLSNINLENVPFVQETQALESANNWQIVLLITYILITTGLLLRFGFNMYGIIKIIRRSNVQWFRGIKVIVLEEGTTPHSFFNTIFLSGADWQNRLTEPEVLTHESIHVQQRHSWDVLLLEFLQIFFWFNPLLIFYKRAIQLNHEFLADQAVLQTHNNIEAYQYLLLNKIAQSSANSFTSRFTYLLTKKRLQMMNKFSKNSMILYKQVALVPLFVCLTFFFSDRLFAQVVTDTFKGKAIQPLGQGVSKELIEEYESTIKTARNTIKAKNGKTYYSLDVRKLNRNRLDSIYHAMSPDQQAKATVIKGILPTPPPPAKKLPTSSQLKDWGNASQYGVWIDGKRIGNNELNKFTPTDFAYYSISRLEKNAINYGKHYYQVDIMTPTYYQHSFFKKTKQHIE